MAGSDLEEGEREQRQPPHRSVGEGSVEAGGGASTREGGGISGRRAKPASRMMIFIMACVVLLALAGVAPKMWRWVKDKSSGKGRLWRKLQLQTALRSRATTGHADDKATGGSKEAFSAASPLEKGEGAEKVLGGKGARGGGYGRRGGQPETPTGAASAMNTSGSSAGGLPPAQPAASRGKGAAPLSSAGAAPEALIPQLPRVTASTTGPPESALPSQTKEGPSQVGRGGAGASEAQTAKSLSPRQRRGGFDAPGATPSKTVSANPNIRECNIPDTTVVPLAYPYLIEGAAEDSEWWNSCHFWNTTRTNGTYRVSRRPAASFQRQLCGAPNSPLHS